MQNFLFSASLFFLTVWYSLSMPSDTLEFAEVPPQSESFVDTLPLPPTAIEVMQANPDACPITEADFARLKSFFDEQVTYYEGLAKTHAQPIYQQWADRIPGLYDTIRSNVRLITKEAFDASIGTMKQDIERFVGQDPYLCFLHGKDMEEAKLHSTYSVAQKLGIPEDHYVTEADFARPEIQEFVKRGGKIVIADDAVYGADNLHLHINAIEGDDRKIQPGQVLVSVVGMTRDATEYIEGWGVPLEVTAQYRIPTVDEVLEDHDGVNDYRILRFMNRVGRNGEQEQLVVLNFQVLTLFWQKVPDNFVKALRKHDNRWWDGDNYQYWNGYLVDDTPDGIHPDYRQGMVFQHS